MNICVPYLNNFPYNSEVDEFTIKYDPSKDTLADLIKFAQAHRTKRINLAIFEEGLTARNLDDLQTLSQLHPRIALQIMWINNPEKLDILKNQELPYYFKVIAKDWEMFQSAITAGASDIYIGGDLGFLCEDAHRIASSLGKRLRAYPNWSQQTGIFGAVDPLKTFFIRPEDLEYYSRFISTFEFDSSDKVLAAVYKIYMKDKKWFGNLDEIIQNLNMELDGKTLLPEFGKFRINCGRRCLAGQGCRRCERVLDLSNALQEQNMVVLGE